MISLNVLSIVAHPDDEILGCGGTLRKHVENGDTVTVVIMSTGGRDTDLKTEGFLASTIIGYNLLSFENYPDQRFDTVPILDIIQCIEQYITVYKPDIIYTHSQHDLNKDHRIIFEAVLTAARPCNSHLVKEIYSFEVLSSTEWGFTAFKPQLFVEINIDNKILAMDCYKSELRGYPHPRSWQIIKEKASVNGSIVLKKYCETFEIIRVIR